MDKAQRDQLRKVLEFHPGEIVPLPGTDTIVELLDQIDEMERELLDMANASLILANRVVGLVDAIRPYYL